MAMPSPRSFEWVRIHTTKPTYPPKLILSSDFGHLILKMLKIKMLITTCLFYVDCAVFVSQFRGFRLQCTAACVFLHFNVDTTYIRSGAGNIASEFRPSIFI